MTDKNRPHIFIAPEVSGGLYPTWMTAEPFSSGVLDYLDRKEYLKKLESQKLRVFEELGSDEFEEK